VAADCACGAAMSAPAIAIPRAALHAVPATTCTCDGLVGLRVCLIVSGRRCRCGAVTAPPELFRAQREMVGNGSAPRPYWRAGGHQARDRQRPVTRLKTFNGYRGTGRSLGGTVRVTGTFNRAVPRNKPATSSRPAAGGPFPGMSASLTRCAPAEAPIAGWPAVEAPDVLHTRPSLASRMLLARPARTKAGIACQPVLSANYSDVRLRTAPCRIFLITVILCSWRHLTQINPFWTLDIAQRACLLGTPNGGDARLSGIDRT
jgi:hypothetical protein